jgi:hypothetical protein
MSDDRRHGRLVGQSLTELPAQPFRRVASSGFVCNSRRHCGPDVGDAATRASVKERYLARVGPQASYRVGVGSAFTQSLTFAPPQRGHTVAFLDATDELLSTPPGFFLVVVGQFAPLLVKPYLELHLLSFEHVFVHFILSASCGTGSRWNVRARHRNIALFRSARGFLASTESWLQRALRRPRELCAFGN